ncbi:hypothetical protein [Mobilicoccus caccae]|uniref:Uncharacterized protein n=1 Tax=Mobilicoccus caccae TaxID=1859295 RepID=A0ABQ6IQP2_9MICO|nr:hypothetical protein [Mobilicoccus caccae]GMA40212.1 hypothetical protein GCM10025883_22570 [Mobilicoccus caccae]
MFNVAMLAASLVFIVVGIVGSIVSTTSPWVILVPVASMAYAITHLRLR